MADIWKAQNFARVLKHFMIRVIDTTLPMHEKMLLLAVYARKNSNGKLDEDTIFMSMCMAFGVWLGETLGEDATDYFAFLTPTNFSPRSIYKIVMQDSVVMRFIAERENRYGIVWPESKFWYMIWDSPIDRLDDVEERIWKYYIHKHAE